MADDDKMVNTREATPEERLWNTVHELTGIYTEHGARAIALSIMAAANEIQRLRQVVEELLGDRTIGYLEDDGYPRVELTDG